MAHNARQKLDDGSHEGPFPGYTSNTLRLFFEILKGRENRQLLDVGQISGDNINFLAKQVERLYVCDLFFHLSSDRREDRAPSQLWRHLDYAPRMFDGILLWDLIDYLDDRETRRVVERCNDTLKPGGLLLLFVRGELATRSVVNSFLIESGFKLRFYPRPHLVLPVHLRKNREIFNTLSCFTSVDSLLYREGLKEFLFRRD